MEEILWHTKQQSRILQEFRQEMQGLWNDSAAQHINMRYLNPHQDDDGKMVDGFQKQHNALEQTKAKLQSANEHALQIEQISQEITKLLKTIQQCIHTAEQFDEYYREYYSTTRSLLPKITQSIDLANSICNGVPTE